MNSVAEALNTLISAVNVAHGKGGVYSLEEAHYIYTAISYLNSLQQDAAPEGTTVAPVAPVAPAMSIPSEEIVDMPQDQNTPQGY